MNYLVNYFTDDNTFCSEVMTMSKLADLIGFADCTGVYGFYIYKLEPHKRPEQVIYSGWLPGCRVVLLDDNGNVVDEGFFEDH